MSGFLVGLAVFWLFVSTVILALAAMPPRRNEDKAAAGAAFIGVIISLALIAAVFAGRALG